jgi:myo-inositol-1(or 4)-monophosphatase
MFASYLGQQFIADLRRFCRDISHQIGEKKTHKSDNSIVTNIDILISDFCKNHSAAKGFSFFSEEDYGQLSFPAMVVDPLDGTLEFVASRAECAVSVAWMPTSKISEGYGLILNPYTGFSIESENKSSWHSQEMNLDYLTGLVSRSEWECGLFKKFNKANLAPRGSIAFKLALLAAGSCDYVVTLKPKNIWDIAAGTILCKERGIHLFSGTKKLSSLDEAKYQGPLIWCKDEAFSSLSEIFLS